MKILIFLILSTFGAYNTNPTDKKAADEETIDMKVVITNIKEVKGTIVMGIYNNSSKFLKEGYAYKTVSEKVEGNQVEITVSGIPKGTYAISLYQDVNSDKKCNRNVVGKPTEPYGFSNGFKRKLSKPSFNDCKVTVNESSTLKVELIH